METRSTSHFAWGVVACLLGVTFAVGAVAQTNDAPLTEKWAPSPWGPDDTAGAVNRITPQMVLSAAGLIRQGKFATLGKVYQSDMPFFGERGFRLTIPGMPTGGPFGDHQAIFNDELVTAEIGQVGTQFDGPGHIGVVTSQGRYFYNGRMLEQVGSAHGLGPLGVEHVAQKGFVCRGVLLDAAAYRGVEMLTPPKGGDAADPGNITGKDIEAIVERQGIAPIREGDCVFLHTGWGNLWHPRDWDGFDAAEKRKRAERFHSGEPGFGRSACDYLSERKIILTGADTWATEAVPGENPDQPFECHVQLQTRHGIWNLENLDLTRLAQEKVYEFLFVWSPLKIKGATGSPGNPVAIY